MELRNSTQVQKFHLQGLSDDSEPQPILFGLFLSMYLITMFGNLLIILAVSSDPHLHTPMYFFLSILSLSDIGFTSTTVPNMLLDIQTHSTAISYAGCLTQMSVFLIFGCMEDMLLTVMAYDRFVAICHPLHYTIIMNPRLCVCFAALSCLVSIFDSLLHNLIALRCTFTQNMVISNFFCDPSQVLNLACSHTLTYNVIMYIIVVIFGFLPISGILFSYYKIVSSILKLPSPDGKYKAFSTCGSHLSIVCLFYGTGFGVYLSSAVSHSPRYGSVASVMYTVVTPMLNPFIYSLRNRDIKNSLRKFYGRIL
ncbi:olfactory receptor 18-like isoform X1 [Dipodomys spectabilis]|uniref:olfactory receptor 18-like isoform X1 n=2 Tax=Dipodomys spectabilis TaxID=105255 RepID=UPI001C54722B|nr:olfactory receptor 18-like isoform X1 [Dipodomys spectabilis]